MAENVKRFTATQILFHLLLMVTFMLLSVTGLAWMFIETAWGKLLAAALRRLRRGPGGPQDHRPGAAGGICRPHPLQHLDQIDWKRFPKSLLGPDTLVFQWVDVKDFFRHLGWIFGLREHPRSTAGAGGRSSTTGPSGGA